MNEPKSIDDVWPHTETILFLTDSDQCFGEPLHDVMESVSRCEHLQDNGYHKDNGLSADWHHFRRDRVEEINEIVPNSLIFVHCDFVIETNLWVYLRGNSIPKASEVVVLMENSSAEAEIKIDNIPRSIDTATSRDDIVNAADEYFNRICPECQGDAARNWVFSWKKQLYQKVEN